MRKMNEAERKNIKWLVWWVMSKATSDEYAERILEHDGFMEDVIADVMECSAWEDEGYYNEDDVRLAIGRVLIDRLGVEH